VTTTWPRNREELEARLRARTRLFGVLLVGSVLTAFLPLPWKLTGLAFGIATVVVGFQVIFALAASRRAGGEGRGFLGVSVGLGVAAVLVVVNLVQAVFYPAFSDLERCLSTASTIAARERCADELAPRLGPASATVGGRTAG
jgi:low temperature requirement protein LtrA